MNIEREELADLVLLLDDNDAVVLDCVDRRLKSYGSSIVRSLINYSMSKTDGSVKNLILEKAAGLNEVFKLKELEDFVTRRPGPLSLFEGSFLICSMLDCRLSRQRYEELFFSCSAEYMSEASDSRTAYENIGVFNHIFFHRLKFLLYDVELLDKQYSLTSTVLKTRKGNPFSIAYIYLMIAQVAGLPLRAICFPGGFVPVYVEDGKELFYINVYRNGEIIVKDNLLNAIKVKGITLSAEQFVVRDDITLLGIYIESLLIAFSRKGENEKSAALERALNIVSRERFLTIEETE